MTVVSAIVLAGAANTGALRECSPVPNEALIEIGGKPMVQYVIDGLRQSERIGRILVTAPPGQLEDVVQGADLEFIPSKQRIVDNILAALKHLPAHGKVLIVTCDIPLITGPIIDGLLGLCDELEADMYYPVVEKSVSEGKYPLVKRTYIRLRDGVFTGGNIFLVRPWIADQVAEKINHFLDKRKNPFAMASIVGWRLFFKLLTHSLTLKEAEERVSSYFGIKGAVVVCPFPEVGIDVDKPSDLQLARAALL